MRSMVRLSVLLRASVDTQARLLQADGAAHCRQILGISASIPNIFANFRCSRPAVPSESAGFGAVFRVCSPPCLSLWERWPSEARTERGVHAQTAARPSQSPSVTALPKGEPRACCKIYLHEMFSATLQSQNCRFLSRSPIKLHQKSKPTCFRALSTHKTHPNPQKPSGRSHRGRFLWNHRPISPHQTNNGEARTAGFRVLSTHPTHPNPHNPVGAATAAKSPRNLQQPAQLSC